MKTLFHLAFPSHDFKLAKIFYHEKLGFDIGRESENAVIFQFAAHQLVAHKIDEPLPIQKHIYPRHFGLIFLDLKEFEDFVERIKEKQLPFEIPLKTRFADSKIAHQTFFLKDPSNNLLEFKYYFYPSAIFGEIDYKEVGEG